MGYYKLVKDGPTIDNILKCFNTGDFSTYPTIESYVNTLIGGAIGGNITGTLADQIDLANALNSKATDSDVVHLADPEIITGIKTFVNTIYIKESESNSVALKCLSSNKVQIGSSVGVSSTLRIGDSNGGGSHRGQVEINADGEITCKEDDYGVTAYLKLPAQGTSSQRATLATLNDIPSVANLVTLADPQFITGYKTFNRANTDDPIITLIGGGGANAKTYDVKVSSDALTIHRNGYVYGQFYLKDGELQTQSLKPVGVNTSYNLGGPSNYGYYNLYLRNKIYSNNNDTYGLVLPDTTNWTADKTIATTEDTTKLYKHTFSYITSEGPIIDYIITATSNPYTFTGILGPIAQIGKDALKIVASGVIILGLSQIDDFKGQMAIITGDTIGSYDLTFNSGGTTIDTVTPL